MELNSREEAPRKRRNSILREVGEENESDKNAQQSKAEDIKRRLSKRVSFAGTQSIKEFLQIKDTQTEWNHTYEEPVNHDMSSSMELTAACHANIFPDSEVPKKRVEEVGTSAETEMANEAVANTLELSADFLSNFLGLKPTISVSEATSHQLRTSDLEMTCKSEVRISGNDAVQISTDQNTIKDQRFLNDHKDFEDKACRISQDFDLTIQDINATIHSDVKPTTFPEEHDSTINSASALVHVKPDSSALNSGQNFSETRHLFSSDDNKEHWKMDEVSDMNTCDIGTENIYDEDMELTCNARGQQMNVAPNLSVTLNSESHRKVDVTDINNKSVTETAIVKHPLCGMKNLFQEEEQTEGRSNSVVSEQVVINEEKITSGCTDSSAFVLEELSASLSPSKVIYHTKDNEIFNQSRNLPLNSECNIQSLSNNVLSHSNSFSLASSEVNLKLETIDHVENGAPSNSEHCKDNNADVVSEGISSPFNTSLDNEVFADDGKYLPNSSNIEMLLTAPITSSAVFEKSTENIKHVNKSVNISLSSSDEVTCGKIAASSLVSDNIDKSLDTEETYPEKEKIVLPVPDEYNTSIGSNAQKDDCIAVTIVPTSTHSLLKRVSVDTCRLEEPSVKIHRPDGTIENKKTLTDECRDKDVTELLDYIEFTLVKDDSDGDETQQPDDILLMNKIDGSTYKHNLEEMLEIEDVHMKPVNNITIYASVVNSPATDTSGEPDSCFASKEELGSNEENKTMSAVREEESNDSSTIPTNISRREETMEVVYCQMCDTAFSKHSSKSSFTIKSRDASGLKLEFRKPPLKLCLEVSQDYHSVVRNVQINPRFSDLQNDWSVLAAQVLGAGVMDKLEKIVGVNLCCSEDAIEEAGEALVEFASFAKDIFIVQSLYVTRSREKGLEIIVSSLKAHLSIELNVKFECPRLNGSTRPIIRAEPVVIIGDLRKKAVEDAMSAAGDSELRLYEMVKSIDHLVSSMSGTRDAISVVHPRVRGE